MRSLVIWIPLTLLIAGCISGGDDPVESAELDTSMETAAVAAAAPEANASAPVEPRAFPFAYEGTTGMWFCVPDSPTSCSGLPAGSASENTFVELEYEGLPSAVDVTLTWSATTPATSEMYIAVFAMRSCGDGCFEASDGMYSAYTSGQSPLTFSATDVVLGENETLSLHVGVVDPAPQAPVPLWYSVEQAFAVEGVVTAS